MRLNGTSPVTMIQFAVYITVLFIGVWMWIKKRRIDRARRKSVEKQIKAFIKALDETLDKKEED